MKDFLGNELSVGDHVVFSSGTYSDNLTKGVVTKINPKMLRIRCKAPKNWDERQILVEMDDLKVQAAVKGYTPRGHLHLLPQHPHRHEDDLRASRWEVEGQCVNTQAG